MTDDQVAKAIADVVHALAADVLGPPVYEPCVLRCHLCPNGPCCKPTIPREDRP